jgi:transposase
MSRYTLANCYKELNIGYLKIHSSFYSARSEEETVRLRVAYIEKVFKYMMQGREIVYMDETSTDCWATRTKIWQPRDSVLPLVVQRTQQKEKNITIIGAISVQNDSLFYLVTYSTTIDTVQDFYQRYKRSEELDDKVLVMDNHRAHWSEQIQDFLENNGATPLYLPPCSSYFNPIETIWSWVKAKWRNSLL